VLNKNYFEVLYIMIEFNVTGFAYIV